MIVWGLTVACYFDDAAVLTGSTIQSFYSGASTDSGGKLKFASSVTVLCALFNPN